MPFITEEIWQRVAPLVGGTPVGAASSLDSAATIMLQPYPTADATLIDESAEAEMRWVMDFIVGVRKIRSSMNIAPGKQLPVLLQNGSADDRAKLDRNAGYLATLAKTESITWLEAGDAAPESAVSLVGEMTLLIPLAGLIDKDAEIARLVKEIGKLKGDLERGEAKLANPNFAEKAKPEVVAGERKRVDDMKGAVAQLEEQLEKIRRL